MTDKPDLLFKYVVVGDGIIEQEAMARSIRLTGKTPLPIPSFRMARTKVKAEEYRETMKPWNKMIVVARVEEVWFNGQDEQG